MIVLCKQQSLLTTLLRRTFAQTRQDTSESDVLNGKIKKYGRYLGPIVLHVHSLPFRQKFQLKKYLHAHSWCCLHAWMLNFRGRAMRNPLLEVPGSVLLRWQVGMEMERFNYTQLQDFTDRKDREIYFELKRISNVLHFALDDYYHYSFKQKPIAQIICEDMGLYPSGELTENDEANVRRIQGYIEEKMSQLRQTPLSSIRSGSFKWSL